MKKLSVLTAAALAIAAVVPVTASADPAEDYAPTFYFTSTNGVTDPKTGDIVLMKDEIPEEGSTLSFNLYVSDESKQLWWFSPKWKCAEPLIKLTDLYDPFGGPEVFAYSGKKADGTLDNEAASVMIAQDDRYNTMGLTVTVAGLSLNPLVPYTEKTDELPLTWFNANVSSEIPCGYYDIYFLTRAEDYADQQFCSSFIRLEDTNSVKRTPIVKNITIRISGTEGDVDADGTIDSTDASMILAEYAEMQTNGESTLDDAKKFAADVDHDRIIDSSDASTVLAYYAYVMSTEKPDTFLNFVEKNS